MTDFSKPSSVNLKTVNLKNLYDYEDSIADYETFDQLGQAITQARLSLFVVTEKLNKAEVAHRIAKTEYDRTRARMYLQCNERTERAKEAYCDIMCEELEDKVIASESVIKQLNRLSFTLREELQALQMLSNNFRQQLKMEVG